MQEVETKPVKPARTNRKPQILAAAESLLRERGLNGVTTRAIAGAVPCSEGASYVHFNDRLELILAVLQESLPEMVVPLHVLQEKLGSGTPEQNLIVAVNGLVRFHDRVAPMLCSLMSDPELLERFRQSLDQAGKGPQRGLATLATYIEQEQKLGRIGESVDAKTAACVLMASSFFHIFTAKLLGSTARLDVKRLVQLAIRVSM
jgi:AcrR family transcriptional regulator